MWTLRSRTLIAGACAVVLVAAWASVATWCLLFRDDLVARMLKRQGALQYAYEERVSALRVRLDRVASQKLLEQDGVETRVADLASRQVALENRQALLNGLAEQAAGPVATGSLTSHAVGALAAARASSSAPVSGGPGPGSLIAPAPAPALSPTPRPMPVEALGLRGREDEPRPVSEVADPPGATPPLARRLARIEGGIEGVAVAQGRALDALARRSRREAALLRSVIADTGLDVGRLVRPSAAEPAAPALPVVPGGVGGPFVPAGAFEADLLAAQRSLVELGRLRPLAAALPLARPTITDAGVTSGFGYRLDPFTRGPALHTGLDLKAENGTAARAAGAGQVVGAEYAGGYGNMVEIDHGHGVTTRYAHLASFAVTPGQIVLAGQTVGRVGSTGRSTGSHLHYETRVDGEPVDPHRFLRAGARLAARDAL